MHDLFDALVCVGLGLLGDQVKQEVEVVERVWSLIEEALHLRVDALVHVPVVILLIQLV